MDFLAILLFCFFYALLFFFTGYALLFFFSEILRFNYLVSELLSAMAIFLLLFGETMFFLKIFAMIFGIITFSFVGYTIIIRAKRMRWYVYKNNHDLYILR